LVDQEENLCCKACNVAFSINRFGYYDLVLDRKLAEQETTSDEFAGIQSAAGVRRFHEFLKPYLGPEPSQRVLDIGSGLGRELAEMRRMGYEAYGVDLPCLSPFWAEVGNDPSHFFCAEATRLPFRDDHFDLVYSFGVVEHICTETDGRLDYWGPRQDYANELVRVTQPRGRILVSCPNKSFPVDIQHGPDATKRLRHLIWERTGLNIHATWGENHLLSYREIKRLFQRTGALSFRALPLDHFFGFAGWQTRSLRLLRPLAEYYVNHLPSFLLQTGFNPYVLLEIRK
jgi:SAM-dependent methyltransferase